MERSPLNREGAAKSLKRVHDFYNSIIDDGFEQMSADKIEKCWPKCGKCSKQDAYAILRIRRLPATDDDSFKNWSFCLICTSAVLLDVACGMCEFEEYSGISNVPVWFLGPPSPNALADLFDEGYVKDIEPELAAASSGTATAALD